MSFFIYKISCKDENITDFYIGSTKNIEGRMIVHKNHCSGGNTKFNNFVKENGGFDNWKYEILETCDFINKNDKLTKEQKYIDKLKPSLNTNKAFSNENDKKEKSKQYYEINKDAITEKAKQYREINKDVIAEKSKQYREINRDAIVKKSRRYYNKNKDIIAEKDKIKRNEINNKKEINLLLEKEKQRINFIDLYGIEEHNKLAEKHKNLHNKIKEKYKNLQIDKNNESIYGIGLNTVIPYYRSGNMLKTH